MHTFKILQDFVEGTDSNASVRGRAGLHQRTKYLNVGLEGCEHPFLHLACTSPSVLMPMITTLRAQRAALYYLVCFGK